MQFFIHYNGVEETTITEQTLGFQLRAKERNVVYYGPCFDTHKDARLMGDYLSSENGELYVRSSWPYDADFIDDEDNR